MGSILEIMIILLLLVANGAFAMAEIAIVAARKARLQQLAEAGNANARIALGLASNPARFLATVQIGITLVGILAGAFGGATLAETIAAGLGRVPLLAPYGESIGIAVVVIGITFLSLVIGELVPKRLALNGAERIATAVAPPMRALSAIAAPVVWLLNVSTEFVIRALRVKPSTEPAISPEEIRVLMDQGRTSGVFEASEQAMIDRVLRLDERRVDAFMIPRAQIVWLDLEDSPENLRRQIASTRYSRFPVGRGSLDHLAGFVRARDLLSRIIASQPLDLAAFLRAPLFIPENMSALRVMESFQQHGTHLALVVDEYGDIQGMVTQNDLLENISGRTHLRDGAARPQDLKRRDGSWVLDGLLPIDELKKILGLARLPEQNRGHYQTVGGFVAAQVGKIPVVGSRFDWEGLRFEVTAMDGRRVSKVRVVPSPQDTP